MNATRNRRYVRHCNTMEGFYDYDEIVDRSNGINMPAPFLAPIKFEAPKSQIPNAGMQNRNIEFLRSIPDVPINSSTYVCRQERGPRTSAKPFSRVPKAPKKSLLERLHNLLDRRDFYRNQKDPILQSIKFDIAMASIVPVSIETIFMALLIASIKYGFKLMGNMLFYSLGVMASLLLFMLVFISTTNRLEWQKKGKLGDGYWSLFVIRLFLLVVFLWRQNHLYCRWFFCLKLPKYRIQ